MTIHPVDIYPKLPGFVKEHQTEPKTGPAGSSSVLHSAGAMTFSLEPSKNAEPVSSHHPVSDYTWLASSAWVSAFSCLLTSGSYEVRKLVDVRV